MVKRFDGANWVDIQSAKRFDGANWIDCTEIKRFDGTNWIKVFPVILDIPTRFYTFFTQMYYYKHPPFYGLGDISNTTEMYISVQNLTDYADGCARSHLIPIDFTPFKQLIVHGLFVNNGGVSGFGLRSDLNVPETSVWGTDFLSYMESAYVGVETERDHIIDVSNIYGNKHIFFFAYGNYQCTPRLKISKITLK